MILLPEDVLSEGIVSSLVDKSKQKQQAGIDLTLKKVFKLKGAGKVDFDNSERKISDVEEIPFNDDGWLYLPQGVYKVVFNEYFKLPSDVAGMCFTRTTLLRSGVKLGCALWDPGFEGMAEVMLSVANPDGIYLKRNARLAQIVFIRLEKEAKDLYEGVYKGIVH